MPPRDASEPGLDLLGLLGEGGSDRGRPPLELRERPEEAGPALELSSESEPRRSSSSSPPCPVGDKSPPLGERSDSADLLRLMLDGLELIGESGTACPAPPGECGGGLSGPSMPPTLGTPGSRRRMWSTSSSAAMRNWMKLHSVQIWVPKSSVSRIGPGPDGCICQLAFGVPERHHQTKVELHSNTPSSLATLRPSRAPMHPAMPKWQAAV